MHAVAFAPLQAYVPEVVHEPTPLLHGVPNAGFSVEHPLQAFRAWSPLHVTDDLSLEHVQVPLQVPQAVFGVPASVPQPPHAFVVAPTQLSVFASAQKV